MLFFIGRMWWSIGVEQPMLQQIIDFSMVVWSLCLALIPLFIYLRQRKLIVLLGCGFIAVIVLLLTQPLLRIPVEKATDADWNPKTFWYEPWGASIVHRGIDIFGMTGQGVIAPTNLLILYTGKIALGGKVIIGIDRSLRVHYFAHLSKIDTEPLKIVRSGKKIGELGRTGNAMNKPPHLHYSLLSTIPQPWEVTMETLGYLRAFYLNPIERFH